MERMMWVKDYLEENRSYENTKKIKKELDAQDISKDGSA